MTKCIYLYIILFFLSSCQNKDSIFFENNRLKFLSEIIIPNSTEFNDTKFGGISGIDYNPDKNIYYMISDDRKEEAKARFYSVKLNIDTNLPSFSIIDVKFLRDSNNNVFCNIKDSIETYTDAESIRYSKYDNTFIWSAEGERSLPLFWGDSVLIQPEIFKIDSNGNFLNFYDLSHNFRINKEEKGIRQNGSLESLSFSIDGNYLYTINEEPFYQDGLYNQKSQDFLRILKIDNYTKKVVAEYPYPLDKFRQKPLISFAKTINGVSEIVAIDTNKLWIVERSFSLTSNPLIDVIIYEIDLSNSPNIINQGSLINYQINFNQSKKTEVIKLSDLNIDIDNIEGICIGPKLKNGHNTLLLVSDNNFKFFQKTQILIFEIKQ